MRVTVVLALCGGLFGGPVGGYGALVIPHSAFWNDAFVIRVTLRQIEPAIWRRIRIPAIYPLDLVHDALQIALGWTNSHLHDFSVGDVRFGIAEVEEELLVADERFAPLGAVARAGVAFRYRYDFGDDWNHEAFVEELIDDGGQTLICLGGERACPPEDCGGPPGYAHLVDVLADPKASEHREMRRWVGKKYDPEAFDLAAVNKKLAALGRRAERSLLGNAVRKAQARPSAQT
jgi:hypothetical protein